MHGSTDRDLFALQPHDAVRQLASWLRDDDRVVALAAAHALATLGDPGLQALISALSDTRVEARQRAALGLGKSRSEKALPRLARAMDDPDVAYFAICALGELGRDGMRSAAQPLIHQLQRPESTGRAQAASELGFMRATEAIPELLAMMSDSRPMARWYSVDALGKMGDRRVILQLIGKMPDADSDMRGRIIRALERLGTGNELIGPTVECLGEGALGMRNTAAYALARLGAPTLEPVLVAARHGSPTGRAWALWTLILLHKQHRIRDKRILETALEALGDPDGEVRARAAEVLGAIEDPHGFEPLIKALEDTETHVRACATFALRSSGSRAFEPLLHELRRSGSAHAATALAHLGDARAIEPLLNGPDGDGRVSFPFALPVLAQKCEAVQKRFYEELKSTYPKVRRSAAIGLGFSGNSWAWEVIVARLADEDVGVRGAAVVSLARIDVVRAIPSVITALEDSASEVRKHAMAVLSDDDFTLDASRLRTALESHDPDVRHFIARKLGELGDEQALAALLARRKVESGMTSKGQSVRDQIIRAAKLIQVRILARM
jgi:HEAT repeat protein